MERRGQVREAVEVELAGGVHRWVAENSREDSTEADAQVCILFGKSVRGGLNQWMPGEGGWGCGPSRPPGRGCPAGIETVDPELQVVLGTVNCLAEIANHCPGKRM